MHGDIDNGDTDQEMSMTWGTAKLPRDSSHIEDSISVKPRPRQSVRSDQ